MYNFPSQRAATQHPFLCSRVTICTLLSGRRVVVCLPYSDRGCGNNNNRSIRVL